MLILLIGPLHSGKHTIAKYLKEKFQFTLYEITLGQLAPDQTESGITQISLDALETLIMRDQNWNDNYLIMLPSHRKLSLVDNQIKNAPKVEQIIETFGKRPFFLTVYVDCPLRLRFTRYSQINDQSLFEFMEMNEQFELQSGLNYSRSMVQADVVIQNDGSIEDLHRKIDKLFEQELIHLKNILRPQWDDYFMLLADLAAHRSNCMKRRVGCILVRNSRVIATGYNGTPRGVKNCNQGGCLRCNGNSGNGSISARGVGLDECLCLHAEENALLEAGRDRIDVSSDQLNNKTILYCNTCPCLSCAKKIIQTGVKEVVYRQEYSMDKLSTQLFNEAGVLIRRHQPLLNLNMNINIF